MRFSDMDETLELAIVGLQFESAEEPRRRFSWYNVEGVAARGAVETWPLRFPALTVAEARLVSAWLREAAEWVDLGTLPAIAPEPLRFLEPNLEFDCSRWRGSSANRGVLVVTLEQEFAAPWDRERGSKGQSTLEFTVSKEELLAAAQEWDDDRARFPDAEAWHDSPG